MKKRLLIAIAVVLWLVPGVCFGSNIHGVGGSEVLGSEINSGTITKDTPYKITATEADHFGTGLIIGDYFVSDGTETCDANNKVQLVLSLPGAGIAFEQADAFHFNVIDTETIAGQFSTTETITVDWGDGTSNTYNGTDQAYTHTYPSGSGTRAAIISPASALTKYTMTTDGANVQFALAELPRSLTYLRCEGSSTISGSLSDLPSGLTYFYCSGSNTVSGALSDLPSDLTFFDCYGSNTISGSLSDLPSDLTIFACSGSNTVSGSLSDLPSGLTYFACTGSNTVSDYTTRTWTTKPATFKLGGNSTLSESEIDQLFIDFNDDLVWSTGDEITITGSCDAPSATSSAARSNILSEMGGSGITTN